MRSYRLGREQRCPVCMLVLLYFFQFVCLYVCILILAMCLYYRLIRSMVWGESKLKCEKCGVELTESGTVFCTDCAEKIYNSLPD